MKKTAVRILRADKVKLEGQFHLNTVQPNMSQPNQQPAAGQPEQNNQTRTEPQVAIVEKHPDFVVIEVTCSCGIKTSLRCEYSNGQADDNTENNPNDKAN